MSAPEVLLIGIGTEFMKAFRFDVTNKLCQMARDAAWRVARLLLE